MRTAGIPPELHETIVFVLGKMDAALAPLSRWGDIVADDLRRFADVRPHDRRSR